MSIRAAAAASGIIALIAGIMAGTLPSRAEEVGAVVVVQRNVYGTPPEKTETPKYVGNPVAYQEVITTRDQSAALIRFIDGSELTIGAKAAVKLDEFVYDPGKKSGSAVISISSGALRFVTGEMPKGNTTITTPTATMVLRGTEVTVKVALDGTTTLHVISGSVDTTSKASGAQKNVTPGHSLKVGRAGITNATGGPSDKPTGDPDGDDHDTETDTDTDTGDKAVDRGVSGSDTGHSGQDGKESTPERTATNSEPGPTGEQNSGSGHGNNGGL